MSRKKQNWEIGSTFLVELIDGTYAVGQIIGREASVLNSISCAFFNFRVLSHSEASLIPDLDPDLVFSSLFITKDLLDKGFWKVAGCRPVTVPINLFPYEHLRNSEFVGASVIGSGIVREFLNAFFGLAPWDDWKDPNYLDKFLISADKKPKTLLLKKK